MPTSMPRNTPYIAWLARRLADPSLPQSITPQHIRHEWETLMHAKVSRSTNPHIAAAQRVHPSSAVWADFADTIHPDQFI